MKRGTTPTLKVKLGISDISSLSKVDFMLKQNCDEGCTIKVKKTYPNGGATYDSENKLFLVSYTESETRTFQHDSTIYLDVRPVLTNGTVLATEIVELFMSPTLFSSLEVQQNE